MAQFSVEVKSNAGIYYKAFVRDIVRDELLLQTESDSQRLIRVPLTETRLPPADDVSHHQYKEGDDVEVFITVDNFDALGWCSAKLKSIKGSFGVVDYIVAGTVKTDIFPLERLRPLNRNQPCSPASFFRHSFSVPTDLHDICVDENCHKGFLESCGNAVVTYRPDEGVIVVLSSDPAVVHRAQLLEDLHVRYLQQRRQLRVRTDEIERRLQNMKQQSQGAFHEEVRVRQDLVGLAIGSHGNNIQVAKRLPGVSSIDLDESSSTFHISGENEDAVKKAKSLLDFCEDIVQVPRDITPRIIGKVGRNIQDIVDKSGIVRVRIAADNEDDLPRQEGHIPFVFVGTKTSIENARLLLQYSIAHLRELELMQEHRLQIEAELRHMSGAGRNFPTSDARLGSGSGGDMAEHHSPRVEPASQHHHPPQQQQQQRGAGNQPQQSRGPPHPTRPSEGEHDRRDNNHPSWSDESRGGRGGSRGRGQRLPYRGFSHDTPPRMAGRQRDDENNGYYNDYDSYDRRGGMQGQGRRPRRPWYGGAARPDRGYDGGYDGGYDRRDNGNYRGSPERPRVIPNEDLGEREDERRPDARGRGRGQGHRPRGARGVNRGQGQRDITDEEEKGSVPLDSDGWPVTEGQRNRSANAAAQNGFHGNGAHAGVTSGGGSGRSTAAAAAATAALPPNNAAVSSSQDGAARERAPPRKPNAPGNRAAGDDGAKGQVAAPVNNSQNNAGK